MFESGEIVWFTESNATLTELNNKWRGSVHLGQFKINVILFDTLFVNDIALYMRNMQNKHVLKLKNKQHAM